MIYNCNYNEINHFIYLLKKLLEILINFIFLNFIIIVNIINKNNIIFLQYFVTIIIILLLSNILH